MTKKVIVGYTLRPMPGTEDEANDLERPYTSTFDQVYLVNCEARETKTWKYDGRKPFGDKPAISRVAAEYLTKSFPGAWPDDTHVGFQGKPEVAIFGFNPRLFLKVMGLECSLPWVAHPAPASLWYTNTDHRDIGEAVMPKSMKLGWQEVIAARRVGLSEDDQKKYDALFADWQGPGDHAERDATVALLFAQQLGFVEALG